MGKTEDEIRNMAGNTLQLLDSCCHNINNTEYFSGIGQITSFSEISNEVGFTEWKDSRNRPDGWYLPKSKSEPAIILECKAEENGVLKQTYIDELFKNIDIASKVYSHTIGILYSGGKPRVFFDKVERTNLSSVLENKDYYIEKYKAKGIDRQKIFNLTSKINNEMHFKLGIMDLYDRMIFTSCALAVVKEGVNVTNVENFSELKLKINNKLKEIFELPITKIIPQKFQILIDIFNKIETNVPGNPGVKNLCSWLSEISENITSDSWNGEDVMSIFFREFNRYKKKSEKGQVFTPENWASFMYRILEIDSDCIVLDATVGSGTFLTVAMAKMIYEVGGVSAAKAVDVRNHRLYGIEFDKRVFALCVANMIIHKDGLSNIQHMDSLTSEASEWIEQICQEANEKKLKIRVLMNPPYEQKYGCLKIVKNVLDSVAKAENRNALAAFILPDKKLEKNPGITRKILEKHTLKKIIKMPENVFDEGVATSIFVFEIGRPHKDNDEIFACYIEDDGFETVKNQGRQDVKGKWQKIEDKWVPIVVKERSSDKNIQNYNIQYFTSLERLSYKIPEKDFEIKKEDFTKTMMDYSMFEKGIDVKDFAERLIEKVMYNSEVSNIDSTKDISIKLKGCE